jgi:hypothetical protein
MRIENAGNIRVPEYQNQAFFKITTWLRVPEYYRRLRRWLLPGGHVEDGDSSLGAAAFVKPAKKRGLKSMGIVPLSWPELMFTAFPKNETSYSTCITISSGVSVG